jgi:hypothetical protein
VLFAAGWAWKTSKPDDVASGGGDTDQARRYCTPLDYKPGPNGLQASPATLVGMIVPYTSSFGFDLDRSPPRSPSR